MLSRDILNQESPGPCSGMPEYREPVSPEAAALHVIEDEDIGDPSFDQITA